MRHRLLLLALLAITAVARPASAVNSTTWGSFDQTATAVGWLGPDAQPLPAGSAIQLIWVGPDGQLAPPDPYTGQPGGDDVLLATRTLTPNAQLPPPYRNKGYLTLDVYTFNDGDAWAGQAVFMRSWHGTAAGRQGSATAYGDSPLFTLTNGSNINPLGVAANVEVSAVVLAHTAVRPSARQTNWLWLTLALLLLTVARQSARRQPMV